MKHDYLLSAMIAMSSCMAFIGCNPEQSELSLDSITEKATVSGTFVYDAGVNMSDTVYTVSNYAPAAGHTVYLEIPYSEYWDNDGNSSSSSSSSGSGTSTSQGNKGNKIYETVTNEAGEWSFEVPTVSEGIQATVRIQDFRRLRSEYVKMNGTTPEFKTSLYEYACDTTVSLRPGSVKILNIDLKGKEVSDFEGFNQRITLKGTLLQAYESGYRQGAYKPAANMAVNFEVSYKDMATPVMFGATTDELGQYTLVLPLRSYEEGFQSLKITPKEAILSYEHFTAPGESVQLVGKYEVEANISRGALKDFAEQEYTMADMYMMFNPEYNDGFNTTTKPATWPETGTTLAGWLHTDSDMPQKATVTGKYLLGMETAFCKGTYANPYQEACFNIQYSTTTKKVYVNTDEEGNFSFELPVKSGETPTITPGTFNKEITHYLAGGETEKISGSFGERISVDKGEWNELGTIYNKFTPQNATGWYDNLSGWVIDESLTGKNTIVGTIYKAVEVGFRNGSYAGVANEPVSITITESGKSTTFVGATNADGEYSIEVSMRYPDEEPAALVVTPQFAQSGTKSSMTHYRRAGSTSTEEILVDYGTLPAFTSYVDGISRWTNRGIAYYDVQSVENESSVLNWSKNLAGWINQRLIVEKNYSQTLTVRGTVMRAIEKKVGSQWLPKWENDPNRMVSVQVNGQTYDVATSSNGQYVVPVQVSKIGTSYQVSVAPAQDEKNVSFLHYPDPAADTQTIITGRYVSVNNILDKTLSPVESIIEITEPSAKMQFVPTVIPDGWYEYGWNAELDN